MLRTKRLDDAGVAKLPVKAKRQTIPDPELRGHYIRITPNGAKSFWAVARDAAHKQIWRKVGDASDMKIGEAREQAMRMISGIRGTVLLDSREAVSFEGVARSWYERIVVKNNYRSEYMTRLYLFKVIVPAFAGMNFVDVRRRHVTALLDKVEDERGARTADAVLSTISTICKWYAHRDENYETPIISGMRRQKKQGRERVLRDHELATLWKEDGLFGNFTKLALLTAQRKEKLSDMRWTDIVDGVWHIRADEREKGTGEALPLPPMALDVLDAQRQVIEVDNPYVFRPAVGGGVRGKLGRAKAKFEARVPMPQWTLHDLRRTARSLMAAADVPDLVAELVLGHKQQGVAGIYNRHGYLDEKGDALTRLAARIRDIVEPAPDNVQKLMSVRPRRTV